MPDHKVIRFPARRAAMPGYTDTAALNDIHAIFCRHGGWDPGTLEDVAQVLARCGRPVLAIRDIEAAVEQTPAGLPQVRVDAGGTTVETYQDQSGALVVAIAATPPDEAALVITLNTRQLHPTTGRRP
jgi:hypothetical protein